MKAFANIFLFVMAFLFLGQVVTGGLCLQKKGPLVGYYSSSFEDWTEETSEDNVREYEDDFTKSDPLAINFDSLSQSVETQFTLFCLQEHILEIIPPPPQA